MESCWGGWLVARGLKGLPAAAGVEKGAGRQGEFTSFLYQFGDEKPSWNCL